MSLTIKDTDSVIASYIFNCHYKRGLSYLKKIMIAFNRSFKDFLKICIDVYYKMAFRQIILKQFDSETFNIKLFMEKLLNKKIDNYPYIKLFKSDNKLYYFPKLKPKNRLFLYYYSMYHGYLPIKSNAVNVENYDNNLAYDTFWSKREDKTNSINNPNNLNWKAAPYHVLKRRGIHDLKYYYCVKKAETLDQSLFVLKEYIYKAPTIKTICDVTCISVFD